MCILRQDFPRFELEVREIVYCVIKIVDEVKDFVNKYKCYEFNIYICLQEMHVLE